MSKTTFYLAEALRAMLPLAQENAGRLTREALTPEEMDVAMAASADVERAADVLNRYDIG